MFSPFVLGLRVRPVDPKAEEGSSHELSRQSDEENRLYTEPRCIEGNQGLPGLLHGRRVEDLAFAQGRGPDPAATDNTANFASTAVLEDPLQQ